MKTLPYHNPRPTRSTRSLLVMLALSAAVLAAIITLTGCGIPVAIGIENEHGTASYSSKGGLVINVAK